MNIKWNLDLETESWAKKYQLPILSDKPLSQYAGDKYHIRAKTWIDGNRILNQSFPDYCYDYTNPKYLIPSPENIIHCFADDNPLEALALVVCWSGRSMWQVINSIYTDNLSNIESTLHKCKNEIQAHKSVESSWQLLLNNLDWTPVMSSKCLHFMSRSLGCDQNPPVPFDNAVMRKKVWPKFQSNMQENGALDTEIRNLRWKARNRANSWSAYNRYMTAIITWSDAKKWSTTELENTVFAEYR